MGTAFDPLLIFQFIPKLLNSLLITFEILIFSLFFGIIAGIILAIIRYYNIPVLREIVILYVSFIRGTPIIIQLFLVFYGIPELLALIGIDIKRVDALIFVIITYTLSNTASFTEIFRGALQAVNKGQIEAAISIGMTRAQTFLRIIYPQSLRVAFPNIANIVISSLKDTSLAFTVGIMDIMGRGETLIAATMHALEVYIALSIIYYIIVLILERGFKWSERYINKYDPQPVYRE